MKAERCISCIPAKYLTEEISEYSVPCFSNLINGFLSFFIQYYWILLNLDLNKRVWTNINVQTCFDKCEWLVQ